MWVDIINNWHDISDNLKFSSSQLNRDLNDWCPLCLGNLQNSRKLPSRKSSQRSGARGRTGKCLEEVGVHFQFLRKMYQNMFVTIPFLVLMFGWCSEGQLDESQKANIVIGFKEVVELIEGGPGAWKKFGCTLYF